MNNKYKYRILYSPPISLFNEEDPDTWHKVFLISKYECPEELDLRCKVNELVSDYHMNKKFLTTEDLEIYGE